jgi:hypothetical protein
MKSLGKIWLMTVSLTSLSLWSADATTLDNLSVMALGAVDGRAVVKMPDGKMQVLKVGDTIPGTQAVISQVLNDKLVVEDTVTTKDKPTTKQVVWIQKAKAGEKSAVQRFESEGASAPGTPIMVGKQVPEPTKPAAPKKK